MSELNIDDYVLKLAIDENKDVVGLELSQDYESKYFYYDGEWRLPDNEVEDQLYAPGNIQIPFTENEDKNIVVNRFGDGQDDSGNPLSAVEILLGTSQENILDYI